jgi:type I restriction enzyme, S subunit
MRAVYAGGWHSLPIFEIADFGSGDSISVARLSKQSAIAPVPVFGGNGIAGYTSSATVSQPTVILGRVGQKCGVVYRNSGPAWITDNALYIRRYKRPVDVRFLALALEAAHLNDVRNRNDLPLITQSILKDVKIPWPESIEEQQHIAETISGADKTIAALEHVIAKKQAMKQGMMQQLLTGRIRLPGYSGDWVRLTVASKSVIKARIGWQGLKANEYRESGTYRLVGGTEFAEGSVDWDQTPFVDKWRYDQDTYIQLCLGDILLTKDGSIGKTAYIDSMPGPATLNSGVFVIRPVRDAYGSRFLYFMLRSRAFEEFISRLSAGSTISHLYQRDLLTLVLQVPPTVGEQRAISGTLADIETEIDTLAVRLDKARTIKQGMMQELLTGRTRLPVQEAIS